MIETNELFSVSLLTQLTFKELTNEQRQRRTDVKLFTNKQLASLLDHLLAFMQPSQ